MSKCSPGSHPHSDQPNWKPAAKFEDYLSNCREGLEQYSERRVVLLLGWSRAKLWRAKMMAMIPEEVFGALLENPSSDISIKALAEVGQMFSVGVQAESVECCPHCGHQLRVRPRISAKNAQIILRVLEEHKQTRKGASVE